MRTSTLFGILCLSTLLAACSGKGADFKLVTDRGEAELKQSIDIAAKDMSQPEARAFMWALESMTLEQMQAAYPNASPRTIYRGVAADIVREAPEEIAQLESVKPKYDALLGELKKIEAEVTGFTLENSFHGLQPTIRARVRNGSALDLSLVRWQAALFIDGQKEPVAEAALVDSYDSSSTAQAGGLRAGQSVDRQFTVGFVTGDAAWTTLAVQNARSRRVVLSPIHSGVKDFNNQAFLDGAPYDRLATLREQLDTARKVVTL